MKQWLAFALAIGLGLAFTQSAFAQIKLGVAGPMTGDSATFQLKNGTEQAVKDINAAGAALPARDLAAVARWSAADVPITRKCRIVS